MTNLNTVYEIDPRREAEWQAWNAGQAAENARQLKLSREGFRPQPKGQRILPNGKVE